MGMLDDAIREHLDLKRRSGSDPSEVAQLETEALGGGKAEESATDSEPSVIDVEADEVSVDDAPEADPDPPVVEETIVEEVAEPEPEPSQPTEQFSPEEVEAALRPDAPVAAEPDDQPEPEPEPAPEAEPELSEPEASQQNEAQPDESAAAAQARDELEETPDFLEETPEHDRLWFERKPPRDFDF